MTKLAQQIAFLTEIDALKGVLRKTSPIGESRKENSAEHSWQVMLSALILAEHANEKIDILRVLKMLAIHDCVEIDVGDTFHYDKKERPGLAAAESAAADRIFSLLPEEQGQEFRKLWQEFEQRETSDAKFAAAVDRLMAFIANANNDGGTWKEYALTTQQITTANAHIEQGSSTLWKLATEIIGQCQDAGHIS